MADDAPEIDPELLEYLSESDDDAPRPFDHNCVVVLDGLPIAPESKKTKLLALLKKALSKCGPVEDGLMMPVVDGKTAGFMFVELETEAGAETCVKNFSDWKLDKKHVVKAFRYADFKYCDEDDEFKEPDMGEYVERPGLTSWLMDTAVRDQFVTRFDDETEVLWMEAKGRPVLKYGGEREKADGLKWTEQRVMWSPQGTYLLTFAGRRGVVLWGGESFEKLGRFPHHNVNDAVWSPCERYLCTWNGCYDNPSLEDALIVWDVRTCCELRRMPQIFNHPRCDVAWSHDGSFMSRLALNPVDGSKIIRVYETPSMTLQSGRSVRASGAQQVLWSPARSPVVAWWAPESNNSPASVTLLQFPGRKLLSQKNLFNIEDPQIMWHPDGRYMCLQALLLTKAQMKRKKQRERAKAEGLPAPPEEKTLVATAFELFRLSDSRGGVEKLEIRERVYGFSWEPNGHRFAVIHGTGPAARASVSFYTMATKKVELLFTLADKPCNRVIWSPVGGTCVLAGLDGLSGILEFYDVDHQTSFITQEHMQCNMVAFDPSGRFVSTAKTQPMVDLRDVLMRDQVENGFRLWTFQGQRIHEEGKDRFFQFLWRPRPKSLLSEKQVADVRKNLKSYIKRYAQADKLAARRRRQRGLVSKRIKRDEFRSLVAELDAEWRSNKSGRRALGVIDDEDSEDVRVERYDQIVSQKVEKVDPKKL